MSTPRVSIIILNWNGWRDTIECLESLYRITYPNYDVIVVDNGSKDESIQKIKEYCEGKIKVESKFFKYDPSNKPIRVFEIYEDNAKQGKFNKPLYEKFEPDRRMILIKNKDNYGFAGGNNIGIKFALSVLNSDYVLLLNNDTVVDKMFLDELVKVAERKDSVGVVGPIIYFYDTPTVIQHTGGKINMWTGRRKHVIQIDNNKSMNIIEVDFVSGACLLVKKKVVEKVGLLDEEYFAYVEDVDWCFRIKQRGYTILSTPRSVIWHKVSMSTGGKDNATVLYYILRNNLLFIRKNAKIYHLPSSLIILGYYFLKRFLISALENPEKARSMIRGLLSNF